MATRKTFSSHFSLSFFHVLTCCYLFLCTSTILQYCNAKVSDGGVRDRVDGMFVFGSSLVDNGNNNFLPNSIAKADFFPYGIDFPLLVGPTGRFTNGKNVIDLLGDYLRLPCLIPVFADPLTKGSRIIHGVNYASGGSGILDTTGFVAGQVITLNQQIKNFEEETLPELEGCRRNEAVSNYLFVVGSGGNDYSFNYFIRQTNNANLQDFTSNLTTSLSHQLKVQYHNFFFQKLYQLGGRKFVLMSINPLGCSPMLKVRLPMLQGCVEQLNQAAQLFNANLKTLVDEIKQDMPGSNLVVVNTYNIIKDIIEDPLRKGFNDTSNPCCEVDLNGVLCKEGGQACLDRTTHVYFDGLHPTEAVNVVIATKAFGSNLQTEVYPFNVKQLSML